MRNSFLAALALSLLVSATSAEAMAVRRDGAVVPAAALAPVPGRVLVVDDGQLRLDAQGRLSARSTPIAALLARHGLTQGWALCKGRGSSMSRFLALTSTHPDFDPASAAAELRAAGSVRAAVPDIRLRLDLTPNDFFYPDQWYAQDGTAADVSLPAAWDVELGSPTVRIGVMDTGVDLGHPDLASQIWTNPGEQPANGLDDDGNGYTDDLHGWDFGDGDADPNPHAVPDPATFDLDVGFHGTFVAGIAAAAANNGEGIAGAAWNCRVVPLKVVNSSAEMTLAALTEAFGYATEMQLEVLNISLGAADEPGVAEYFQELVDAATAAGVLCVASAGNSGTAELNYPAACSGVLSVAATDDLNDRASFSNYGPTVRIAAPGAAMWSAICRNYEIDEFSTLFYEVFFFWDGVNPYMFGDGTSFSAPLVAGACALVRSQHPTWTPATVAAHMIATGDFVAYDQPIGPKLNVHRAVTEMPVSVESAGERRLALSVAPNPATVTSWIRFTLPVPGRARLRVHDVAGRLVRELASEHLPAGAHEFRWDGTAANGRPVSAGVYLVRLESESGTVLRKLARTR